MDNIITAERVDRISSLPPEILHEICAYLFPIHKSNIALDFDEHIAYGTIYPLRQLSLTSKTLKDAVNQFCLHFFRQHAKITRHKSSTKNPARDYVHGKYGLLTWQRKHCAFCGKKSARRAILMNGLRCCAPCDKEQWPDKITKTEAKKAFDLKDYHILPHLFQDPAGSLRKRVLALPKLRYGYYICSNIPTTMFIRQDVRRLAELVHGDVDAHMKRKAEESVERARKQAEKQARVKQVIDDATKEEQAHGSGRQAGTSSAPIVLD